MTTQRNIALDIISGILIIWMIVYHSFQWGNLTQTGVYTYLIRCFYFFMPWFYFKSGFVYNSKRSLREVVKKSLGQILVPMIIWTLLGYVTTIPDLLSRGLSIWEIFFHPIYFLIVYGDTLGNAPLWFLLSLFFVRIVLNLVAKLDLKFIILLTISIAAIGWMQQSYFPQVPFGHKSFSLGITFALLGFLCNRLALVDKIGKLKIPLLLITIIMSVFFASYIDVHANDLKFGNYWIFIVNSLFAILISIVVFGLIKPKLLAWVGKKSMYFLVIHWPVFYIVDRLYGLIDIPTNNYFYILLLTTVALLLSSVAAKFLPERYMGLDGSRIIDGGKQILIKICNDIF